MGDARSWLGFVVAVLAVWRIAHLIAYEDGPLAAIARLRGLLARAGGVWGSLLDCFYCVSLWVAAPCALALGWDMGDAALAWPALSAGAMLIERLGSRSRYVEDKEV